MGLHWLKGELPDRSNMTLKIEKYADGHGATIRLIGRMRAEHLEELDKAGRSRSLLLTLLK